MKEGQNYKMINAWVSINPFCKHFFHGGIICHCFRWNSDLCEPILYSMLLYCL